MKLIQMVGIIAATAAVNSWFAPVAVHATQHTHAYRDPGADVGIVTESTAMFAEPDADGERISSLKRGDWTILVSRQETNGWLNVIELSSGRQGWVRADRLSVRYTHHRNSALDLPSESTGTDSPPVIFVKNETGKQMYLHIGGEPEIDVAPHSEQDVTVEAGVSSYNASAADVIPLFGNKAFVTGDRYTWTFWIGNGSGSSRRRPVNASLKAEERELQLEIDSETASLKATKQTIDDEQAALTIQDSKLQADQADVETKRQSLDHSDQSAVDDFNNEVTSTNTESDAYNTAQQKYNNDISAYNSSIDSLKEKHIRLEQIADTINRE